MDSVLKRYTLVNTKEAKQDDTEGGVIYLTSDQDAAFKKEGWRVVLGGILIHFVLGTCYLWGGISLYVASYLRVSDPTINIDLVQCVFPFMSIFINSVLSFGVKLSEKIGYKLLLLGGIILIALANLLVSYIQSFTPFVLVYTVMIGLSSGLMYMIPILCGWKYFPHKKGIVSGCIVAGYGFGPFTFNFIALALVNPNNIPASVPFGNHKYFPEEVYSRVPLMFRYLALCYLIIGCLGVFLIKMPRCIINYFNFSIKWQATPMDHDGQHLKQDEKIEEYRQCRSVAQGIRSRPFWILISLVFTGSFFGLLMANNYKIYGFQKLANDKFLTIVGSVGSAANGCSRLFWAYLLDKYGFRKVYFVLMAIQIFLVGTLENVASISSLYLLWYGLIMATEGGQFAIMPVVTTKVFGQQQGPLIYGIIFFGFALANISSFFLIKLALAAIGWGTIFNICFVLSVIAFILNIKFREKHDFV